MSVKTIFKALIGTTFIIVISSICIELFNVNVSGLQVKTLCNISAKQSAELFTQETYRRIGDINLHTEAATSNMQDILDSDGNLYISGNFYGNHLTVDDIWNELYGHNDFFKAFCTIPKGQTYTDHINIGPGRSITVPVRYSYVYSSPQVKYKDAYKDETHSVMIHQAYPWAYPCGAPNVNCPINVYKELGQLYAGINDNYNTSLYSTTSITFSQYISGAPAVRSKSYATTAIKMRENYYTPVNVGFPYFNAEVTNNIFQWELAMLLSNGLSSSIVRDEAGRQYINYKGFRCYVQDAYITDFKYYIIDARSDVSHLRQYTNMEASGLRDIGSKADLDNGYVTVVGIEYTMPIAYQGITPLKRLFEYAWNNEVAGQTGSTIDPIQTDRSGMTGTGIYSYGVEHMTNEDTTGNGALPSTGRIYYVLVR